VNESQLQDAIRLALGRHPDLALFRNNIGVAERRGFTIRFGVGGPGGADLIGLFRGRFLAVEIKTQTGRQSEEQRTFQQLIERKGGVYVVLRSVEDALAWLASMDAAPRPEAA
jgi:hypothetical protein